MGDLLRYLEEKLIAQFGEKIISAEQHYDFPVFVVEKTVIKEVLSFLKTDKDLGFHFLTTLCGLHFPDFPAQEMGMMYQLQNMRKGWRVRIKTFMSKEDTVMPTVTDIFPTANWMEREAYDFYGFTFDGHPNLKRILNMDEMNYHPLLKQYPLEDLQREDKDDKMFGR